MPDVLRFGISSLDELLGNHPSQTKTKNDWSQPFGIYLPPKEETDNEDTEFTTSMCIIGPDGAGKSIFGLHLASTYLADCIADQVRANKDATESEIKENLPTVLYVSTDLTYKMAHRAWDNFALNYPFARHDPFSPTGVVVPELRDWERAASWKTDLAPCNPTGLAKDFDILEKQRGSVIFVDIASHTAGDDWGFLHKLLSLLPTPGGDAHPRHLIVIDAIEGFEALAGELNAFGEKSTRRSRVTQVMRLIAGKCHALLIVEESKKQEKLAEEFIADTVIKLENLSNRNYERRVLKIEKVRGQSHIRGQHHYSIRSGSGSTTGSQVNPDDPEIDHPALAATTAATSPPPPPPPAATAPGTVAADAAADEQRKRQSYVQIFHSVHRLNRKIMEIKGEARKKLRRNKYYAAFGIKYLDNMLGGKTETTERKKGTKGYEKYYRDTRGLPARSTTALIGDSLTQKSILGKAFLSRCFYDFDRRLLKLHALVKKPEGRNKKGERASQLWELIKEKLRLLSDAPQKIDDLLKDELWDADAITLITGRRWKELEAYISQTTHLTQPLFGWEVKEGKRPLTDDEEAERITRLAAWLMDYRTGVAVMLVTYNTHHEQLAKEFIGWLHTKSELEKLNKKMKGYTKVLKNYIEQGTICRRLEIHNLSSEILIHIAQQLVTSAQRKILTRNDMSFGDVRYQNSWPIRFVIDDLSTFREIFPELREDPLLLPSILFGFEREGVTTLIVDTQSGKPETPIAERFESELRQIVQHTLYTWRVPFYGESRVAITAIPPISNEYAGIVRELRWEAESSSRRNSLSDNEAASVDPHLELYTGLEENNPRPVPLRVQLYVETPAMETYIEAENRFLDERFVSHATQTSAPSVIVTVPATNYNDLRDFAYLQRDTRLDHALVFQVDEFWAMRPPTRRKRAGAFHPQWSYLNAVTATSREHIVTTTHKEKYYQPDLNVDPYELFQLREIEKHPAKNKPLRRRHFYEKYYADFSDYGNFEDPDNKEDFFIDRVPFSWDFGFLICQERAWQTDRTFQVKNKDGKFSTYKVSQVWQFLTKAMDDEPKAADTPPDNTVTPLDHISWRIFMAACKKAAERQSDKLSKPVTAFDFAQISPESFSCLILEMWFSEIYDCLQRKKKANPAEGETYDKKIDELIAVSKRSLFIPVEGNKPEKELKLSYLLKEYWLELYKCWLLLIEVINFQDIVGEATALNFDFKSKNTDFYSVASRHWYKTASQCPDEIATKEPLVAVRLPGRFSVRGDWFLAISGSSRSTRQAERALDLLNSRRANVTRLQLGIGLPTRSPQEEGASAGEKTSVEMLRTKLISHQWSQDNIEYKTFLKIAAHGEAVVNDKDDSFYWLWRGALSDYAHSNRIWHKWLNRTLLWWYRKLLRYGSVWKKSFSAYDQLTNNPPTTRRAPEKLAEFDSNKTYFAPANLSQIDELESPEKRDFLNKVYGVDYPTQLKVRGGYLELLEVLEKELKQAYEANSI